ncbi:hypothetical protein HW130_15395 [Streptomyces sp. PKU-EA00015]|uniref:hypothetical protein n=1 Tax=Streptomyces sp. PKU-EA00015 TaxID=2748326 RepID=UPI0015A21669|nr:hypothetical protein [Streptomyces sp. PKU-EA00015]NWF27630.1 hypothetical protein [Streptomyces sp. PKU-EA00015]
MRGSRSDRVSRSARPTALLSSVATLLGALFICLGPSAPAPHRGAAHEAAAVRAPGATGGGPEPSAVFSCPYDRGDCGLLPVLGPAVLTAPPLDAPLAAAAELPYTAAPADGGGPPRTGALPRAPDLHVLQVLRA